jgi:Flp pilus assembly protein TadB
MRRIIVSFVVVVGAIGIAQMPIAAASPPVQQAAKCAKQKKALKKAKTKKAKQKAKKNLKKCQKAPVSPPTSPPISDDPGEL